MNNKRFELKDEVRIAQDQIGSIIATVVSLTSIFTVLLLLIAGYFYSKYQERKIQEMMLFNSKPAVSQNTEFLDNNAAPSAQAESSSVPSCQLGTYGEIKKFRD